MSEPLKPITLTVTPVPATKSRTMNLANVIAALGGILTLLPELATDPIVVSYLDDMMSPGARRTFGVVMVVIGFYLRQLRKDTVAPIAGTPAAQPDADRPKGNQP